MQTHSGKKVTFNKQFLKNLLKSNKYIYFCYFWIVSFFLRVCRIFVTKKDNLILFVVYGGSRYDDSPRFVYEQMKKDPAFDKFELVWAFQKPEEIAEVTEGKIRIDTWEYFKTALAAKYWITNSSVSRGLSFQGKHNAIIYFEHGIVAIKTIGVDIKEGNESFHVKEIERKNHIFIGGTEAEENILKEAWKLDSEVVYKIGLPRNDELYHCTRERIAKLREQFKIPQGKKVILYAPTFREYNRDETLTVYFKPPIDVNRWKSCLGEEYVLLMAGHYEIQKMILQDDDEFVINCFGYPHINDLMMVSDVLVSDYSSIIFDYAILERPILAYAYDFDEYERKRGVYPGYEQIFHNGIIRTEDELIQRIQQLDYEAERLYTRDHIKNRFLSGDGNAAKTFVELFKKDIVGIGVQE
jgi:CDP-glycerol glycerophosphotransferase